MHRLISCEEGPVIWTWTKTRIAAILRIHPNTYQGNGPYARLSITGSPKAGGDNMDRGPSRSIPSPDKVTPLSNRLRGLPATSPLERVPPSTQDTHSRKVPGCAIVPSLSNRLDLFKVGLKGDSMAPYSFGRQTPPILSRTHQAWRWHFVAYGTKRPVRNTSQPVYSVTCQYQNRLSFKKNSRWCQWKFSLTQSFRSHCGPGVDSASNRNECQGYFLGVKSGRCVRLTTLPQFWARVTQSGNLNFLQPSGNLGPVMGLICHSRNHFQQHKFYRTVTWAWHLSRSEKWLFL